MPSISIKVKRIYEPHAVDDGYRILVDRLWPRGVKKEKADIDLWLKNLAPSTKLREWFGHDPVKWSAFRRKYINELKENDEVGELMDCIKKYHTVTLLYAAKDQSHNQAIVLQQYARLLIQ